MCYDDQYSIGDRLRAFLINIGSPGATLKMSGERARRPNHTSGGDARESIDQLGEASTSLVERFNSYRDDVRSLKEDILKAVELIKAKKHVSSRLKGTCANLIREADQLRNANESL
jgi:hypothetical protein